MNGPVELMIIITNLLLEVFSLLNIGCYGVILKYVIKYHMCIIGVPIRPSSFLFHQILFVNLYYSIGIIYYTFTYNNMHHISYFISKYLVPIKYINDF